MTEPSPQARGGTGAARFVAALERLGVEVVFGLPGVHNLAIWDALAHSSIRVVGVRHEQAAAYAADGYARASGRLGVAVVTTGPGAANTLAAFGEARASGSSVLVVATDISTRLRKPGVYRGVLHEATDQAGIFAPLAKATFVVEDAADIAILTVSAGRQALAAPSGPVYLGIPTDLLVAGEDGPLGDGDPDGADVLQAGHVVLDDALRAIATAADILIWAGGGAIRADAGSAIGELATRLAAPVVTTFGGRGILEPGHPYLAPALVHMPEIGVLWDEADLVIAIGTDFDGMMTQNWAMPTPRRLLTINVDPADAAKNYTPDLQLTGDARGIVERLLESIPPRASGRQIRDRLVEIAARIGDRIAGEEPGAVSLLEAMASVVPDDAVVVADMCIAGYWLAAFHRIPGPRRFAFPIGWGTLGFAVPAAIGASLAAPRVVSVVGDGGFLFACGELATAVQERLPITFVVVDDGGYGMLRFDQERAGHRLDGMDLQSPDFVALAGAFGVPAVAVTGFGPPFTDHLAAFVAASGPNLIHVHARLSPPETVSMRWYRAGGQAAGPPARGAR